MYNKGKKKTDTLAIGNKYCMTRQEKNTKKEKIIKRIQNLNPKQTHN